MPGPNQSTQHGEHSNHGVHPQSTSSQGAAHYYPSYHQHLNNHHFYDDWEGSDDDDGYGSSSEGDGYYGDGEDSYDDEDHDSEDSDGQGEGSPNTLGCQGYRYGCDQCGHEDCDCECEFCSVVDYPGSDSEADPEDNGDVHDSDLEHSFHHSHHDRDSDAEVHDNDDGEEEDDDYDSDDYKKFEGYRSSCKWCTRDKECECPCSACKRFRGGPEDDGSDEPSGYRSNRQRDDDDDGYEYPYEYPYPLPNEVGAFDSQPNDEAGHFDDANHVEQDGHGDHHAHGFPGNGSDDNGDESSLGANDTDHTTSSSESLERRLEEARANALHNAVALAADQEHEEEPQGCSICLDPENRSPIVHLDCEHAFNEDCTETWMNYGSTCPICRGLIVFADGRPGPAVMEHARDETDWMQSMADGGPTPYAPTLDSTDSADESSDPGESGNVPDPRGSWVEGDPVASAFAVAVAMLWALGAAATVLV